MPTEPLLSHAERVELYEAHERVGHWVARRLGLAARVGHEDAEAVARLAVWEATGSFDPDRRVKFSTYCVNHCTFRIRAAVARAGRQAREWQATFGAMGRDADGAPFDPADRGGSADPAAARDAAAVVRGWLARLSPRERVVVELCHGLTDGDRWTLQRVAASLGLSHQRVQQHAAAGMRRLRELAGVA